MRRGLHLLITSAGGRLWRLAYHFDGKQKTLSFGSYPDGTLLEASAKRDAAKKLLANEQDPNALSKADKQANTFKVWGEVWLAHWQADKIPRHVEYTQRRLEADMTSLCSIFNLTI